MAGKNADVSTYELATGVAGVVFSPDQKLIYVAVAGAVQVFDVKSHALVSSWTVGKDLGALSVSADGSFLVATELQTNGTSKAYRIDTTTGTAVSAGEAGAPFRDVQIVDAHTAILTGGQEHIQMLDLDTMTYTTMQGGVWSNNYSSLTLDGHYTLLAEAGISNGPMYLFDDRLGQIVAYGDDYQHGGGYNTGAQAISEAAGQVAQFIYSRSIYIYDLNLDFQREIQLDGPVSGIDYDKSGDYAYVYMQSGDLIEFDTDHWRRVATFHLGWDGLLNHPYGDSLTVTDTGDYVIIKDTDGAGSLSLVDLSEANGVYKGTAGADAMAGGAGNDVYIVNDAGDGITELKDEGYDRVKSSIDVVLAANVEDLDLGGAAVSGTGNAGDNLINGSVAANVLDGMDGDDQLFGGRGDDSMLGGRGADVLHGGAGADSLDGGDGVDVASYEDAARGVRVDLARTDVQQTKGGGADILVSIEGLIGSAFDDQLKGDGGDNLLDGGAGDDVLAGGGGADTMVGGDGADTFRFLALEDSKAGKPDLIVDLRADDVIDLSTIDANTSKKGDQAFHLVDGFGGNAGEAVLKYEYQNFNGPYFTSLSLDVDGDGEADMVVDLAGDQSRFHHFVL